MLTCFSSTFSDRQSSLSVGTAVYVGPNSSKYYCTYYKHDALTNAGVHSTSAANSTSTTNCRDLNVFRIMGSGSYNVSIPYNANSAYPYTGSLLLYVLKQSEGQTTGYNARNVDIKLLPLYANSADVVFSKRFFSNSRVPRMYSSDIRFDVRTNITIKPNQRLRCCMVCFYGHQNSVSSVNLDLTTTVFYNGN